MGVGYSAVCWVDAYDQSLGCTGSGTSTYYGYTTLPPSGGFKDVSVGRSGACAVDMLDRVQCWDPESLTYPDPFDDIPSVKTFHVAVGAGHAVSLHLDGGITPFGSYSVSAPAGSYKKVSAGYREQCGVTQGDLLSCWADPNVDGGDYAYANTDTPSGGTWLDVGAGYGHACGIRSDGTLSCWGSNTYGQATPPFGVFTAVAAGQDYSCAVAEDTTIACWGDTTYHGSPDRIPERRLDEVREAAPQEADRRGQ